MDQAEDPAGDGVSAVRLDFASDPHAVRLARRATRDALVLWRLCHLVDAVVLAASELVTNAIRHGRPPVTLELRRQAQAVRLDVHDGDPTEPVLTAATADVESGRGLAIVRALADSVAVEQVTGDGKILRASFTTEQEAPRAV